MIRLESTGEDEVVFYLPYRPQSLVIQSVESLHVGAAAEPLPGLLVPSAEELEQMEQASAAASEVTNTVLKQRLQIDEKNRTVQMLQKALVCLPHNLMSAVQFTLCRIAIVCRYCS